MMLFRHENYPTFVTKPKAIMSYEITGVVIAIGEVQEFTGGFRKREFVISDGHPEYPEEIPFELVKDKCGLIDGVNVGDEVEIKFNLCGRFWEKGNRWFGSNKAWFVRKVEKAQQGTQEPAGGPSAPEPDTTPVLVAEDDDVPF